MVAVIDNSETARRFAAITLEPVQSTYCGNLIYETKENRQRSIYESCVVVKGGGVRFLCAVNRRLSNVAIA